MPILANAYYVYFLIDPRDAAPFYIGKGKGKRVSQHAKNAKNGVRDNPAKIARINDILAAGFEVVERICAAGLTEPAAFRLERDLIELHSGSLTNLRHGHLSANEVALIEALELRRRLRTYGEWIWRAPIAALDWAEAKYGHPSLAYDDFRAQVDDLINWIGNLNSIEAQSSGARR
jgi:hypothetical protein